MTFTLHTPAPRLDDPPDGLDFQSTLAPTRSKQPSKPKKFPLTEYDTTNESEEQRVRRLAVRKLYTDKKYRAEITASPLVSLLSFFDPKKDELPLRFANMAYLSYRTGEEIPEMDYDFERAAFVKKHFGERQLSEPELFQHLQKEFKDLEELETTALRFQDLAVLHAFEDVKNNTRTPISTRYQNFVRANPQLLKSLGEEELFAIFDNVYENTRNVIDPVAGPAGTAFDLLRGFTGAGNSGNEKTVSRKQLEEFAYTIGQLPRDESKLIFQAISMAARGLEEGDRKNFMIKMSESFGRGLSDINDTISLTARENGLLALKKAAMNPKHKLQVNEKGEPIDGRIGYNKSLGYAPGTRHWRYATEEDRARIVNETSAKLDQVRALRRLYHAADTDIDPILISAEGWLGSIEGNLYGASRATPSTAISAIPAGGPAIGMMSTYASEYNRLRLDYDDLDPEAAKNMAVTSTMLQAPLQFIKLQSFGRMLPRTAQILDRMGDASLPLSVRLGTEFALDQANMNIQSVGEDLAPILVEAIADGIGYDLEGFDLRTQLDGLVSSRGDRAIQNLFLGLISGGAITHRELKRGHRFTQNRETLIGGGFSEKEASSIAAEPDPDKRDEMIRKRWSKRTKEDIDSGPRVADAATENLEAALSQPGAPKMLSTPLEKRDIYGNPIVRYIVQASEAGPLLYDGIDFESASLRYDDALKAYLHNVKKGVEPSTPDSTTARNPTSSVEAPPIRPEATVEAPAGQGPSIPREIANTADVNVEHQKKNENSSFFESIGVSNPAKTLDSSFPDPTDGPHPEGERETQGTKSKQLDRETDQEESLRYRIILQEPADSEYAGRPSRNFPGAKNFDIQWQENAALFSKLAGKVAFKDDTERSFAGITEHGTISIEIARGAIERREAMSIEMGRPPGEYSGLVIKEELDHLARLFSLREDWLAENRPGKLEHYVQKADMKIFEDIQVTIKKASPQEKQALTQAVRDSHNLYFSKYNVDLDKKYKSGDIFAHISSHGPAHTMVWVEEFLRQVTQLRKNGKITEEVKANIARNILEWVRDALRRIHTVLPDAYNGRFGSETEKALKRVEEILSAESSGTRASP